MAFRLPLTLRLTGVRQIASGLGELGSGSIKRCGQFQVGGASNTSSVRHMAGSGEYGSGAGKGGGSGGSIREAGGAFGKMEVANEEMYFRRVRALQLKKLKEHCENEMDEHEKAIREHQESIDRHKKKIQKIQAHEKEISHVIDH